jgi:glycine hydroxymethyltransferase
MLIDLRGVGVTGKVASDVLDHIGITVNKNSVPFDEVGTALNPSGIRVGSAACTTRGLKEKDFEEIADIIDIALKNPKDAAKHADLRARTGALCERYPLYGPMMQDLFAK